MDGSLFYFDRDVAAVVDDYDDDYLMNLIGLLPPPDHVRRDSSGAFAAYQRRLQTTATSLGSLGQRGCSSGGGANVHRRMHRYLRSIVNDVSASTGTIGDVEMKAAPTSTTSNEQHVPRSSRFRHITRERLRRERLSQGYADLHGHLPPGRASKGGKNFVVAAAAEYIRELEGRKGLLSARNEELEQAAAPQCGGDSDMVVKVRAESWCGSMVDVFEEVLRRLKAMEALRVTAIQSRFCAGVMFMDVGVESKISLREVDKAIRNALVGLEEIKSVDLLVESNQKYVEL